MTKFDMDAYTKRRLKELRGEKVYADEPTDEIMQYTRKRMREICQREEAQRALDSSRLGCDTVGRMGDRDGET